MDENRTIWKNAINYGAITGLSLVVFTIILYVTNLTFNKSLGFLNYGILILFIVIATKKQRESENGIISFGKAFGLGVIVSLISAIILGIFMYFLYAFIDPDLIQKISDLQEQELLAQGLPDEQVENAIEMAKKFVGPTIISIGTVFGFTFIGTIISLITSAILKKTENFN